MYKMVVFDIDGTLVPYLKNQLCKDIEEMLEKLKKNGYIVTLATGRDFVSISQIHKNKNIDYLIGANGSFIYDLKNEKYIFNSTIDPKDFENYYNEIIIKNTDKIKSVILSDQNYVYVWEIQEMKYPWFWDAFRGSFKDLLKWKEELDKDSFHLITIAHDKGSTIINETEKYLSKSNQNIYIQAAWEQGFFLANNGVNKSSSIKKLCGYLSFKMEDVIAFGDGENDMEMIESVGLGVAMGNAIEELKNVAKDVTKDVNEHGTKVYLEKIGII